MSENALTSPGALLMTLAMACICGLLVASFIHALLPSSGREESSAFSYGEDDEES
jgi:hypothetical protein